ncbi:MAG TPA: ferrous iron transport protein B [Candidatus Limnocylindrales bacterium]|nr:ferrous iron transport protein B [Candidatus Limnocylindrales bacterium]
MSTPAVASRHQPAVASCHDPAPASADSSRSARGASAKRSGLPLIAVVGNPNTGKTTLFNRLTGQRARVGNYPGITVDRRSGRTSLGSRGSTPIDAEVFDVPGCYSLSARSSEEKIAIDAILGWNGNPRPDLALIVVDATQLVRNLYLVLQILELGVRAVVALNLIDEAGDAVPDARALSLLLGVPCIPTSARSGQGVAELEAAVAASLQSPPAAPHVHIRYPHAVVAHADRVADAMPAEWLGDDVAIECAHVGSDQLVSRRRALALWALTSVHDDDELEGIPADLRARVGEVRAAARGRDIDGEIIGARYEFLDAHVPSLFAPARTAILTERIDSVLLHPVWGFATFMVVMFVVFQSLFAWADPAIKLIETAFAALGGWLTAVLPAGVLTDLLVDGVIGGVGNVLVFLPQILLLFLMLGVLEDSGYLARVAYLMDRIMKSVGLHGRAFVPMLSGFSCAIPAIMATRTMESRRDRLLTMMVIPLMTCSARLPVYTLIIAALYPPSKMFGVVPVQGLLMIAMYLFSTATALAAAAVFGRTVLRGPRVPLILELPPYRMPMVRSVLQLMWLRSKMFLTEAGSVILWCTIGLWVLLSFPKLPEPPADAPPAAHAQWEADSLANSFGGRMGKALEPAIAPLGFDWKIGVGIVGAFAAREVFVSTMGVIYGVGDKSDETSVTLRDKMRADVHANGRPVYSPLVGLSLMVFFALACQCMSTLAVVRRETGGWRWPAFLFAYMTVLAWVASFAVYQGGKLAGLG